jgi:osmoprotectant transport system permease protein
VSYLFQHPDIVGQLSLGHIRLVGMSLLIALAIAVPVAIVIARRPWLAAPLFDVFSLVYTIPSLALFALLVPVLGLGFWTAVAGLAAYAQMILVRNTVAALTGVDPAILEAAHGMGMTPGQVLWRVQRPLGMPVFVAGVRVATVSLIGIAAIAAWINAGGLGTLVLDGIEHDYPQKALAGALAAVVLAVIADQGLRVLERRMAH